MISADWFLYVALFTEKFHAVHTNRRPVYLDVAANHARRWSNTYFFDRCMGWNGVCVEANPVYRDELRNERHCHLIDRCVSDSERQVNFSFTEAFGGVVVDEDTKWGVDGDSHKKDSKFYQHFKGIRSLTCTTLEKELSKIGMKHIDFLSLDVEGHELPVLNGINWNNTRIDVIVIENKSIQVAMLLLEKGYERIQNVLKDDIYLRKGSGYSFDEKFVDWVAQLNKTDYRFHLRA